VLSNAIVIEAVFAWPGIGRLLIESVFARDYPLVQAAVFVIAALVIITNIVNDLVCAMVDPRIRLK
jgi:peptide/nickel transport system permease protein